MHKWRKKEFNPGGEHGKLHRELHVAEDEKIPAAKLAAAKHSRDPEIRRDAIRADTMKHWNHHKSAADRRYGK